MSRRGELAVFAFSRGREIGVDVEAIGAESDADRIAERLFSPRERQAYAALPAADRALGFLNWWTRKEAFVKATGEGLSMPLDRFDVTLAPGEPARLLRVEDRSGREAGWVLHSFVPAPGYVAALACGRSRTSGTRAMPAVPQETRSA